MKKMFVILALLLLGVILLFNSIDINRIGKDNLYVEIIDYSDTEETKLDSGEVITRYIYEQKAFDKNGKSVEVDFSAGKKLGEGYLKLYVKDVNVVTSYDEVQWNEIPADAQVAIKNYYNNN